jgi:hypothetical protein
LHRDRARDVLRPREQRRCEMCYRNARRHYDIRIVCKRTLKRTWKTRGTKGKRKSPKQTPDAHLKDEAIRPSASIGASRTRVVREIPVVSIRKYESLHSVCDDSTVPVQQAQAALASAFAGSAVGFPGCESRLVRPSSSLCSRRSSDVVIFWASILENRSAG